MDYITCNAKKSRPRVNVAVCAKCRRKKGCPDYGNYRQLSLFPELFQTNRPMKETFIRFSKPIGVKFEHGDVLNRPEQLALNLFE